MFHDKTARVIKFVDNFQQSFIKLDKDNQIQYSAKSYLDRLTIL